MMIKHDNDLIFRWFCFSLACRNSAFYIMHQMPSHYFHPLTFVESLGSLRTLAAWYS